MVSKYRIPISILKKAVLVGCNTVSGWDCDELTFDNVRLWCHLDWICVTTQPYNTQVTDVAPNLHFPHLHRTQIYTNPRFTPDPNLHKPRFTRERDPYLHSPDLHKSISVHRFQKTAIMQIRVFNPF